MGETMSFAVPAHVAWCVDEEQDDLAVYLMKLPHGDPVALKGVSALIWVAAVEGEDVVSVVAAATGEDRQRVEPECLQHLDDLAESGYLRRLPDGGGDG